MAVELGRLTILEYIGEAVEFGGHTQFGPVLRKVPTGRSTSARIYPARRVMSRMAMMPENFLPTGHCPFRVRAD
jgi:hypothetical protein